MPALRFPNRTDRSQIDLTGRGLIAEAFPIAAAVGGTTATSQTAFGSSLGLRAGDVCANISMGLIVAGASTPPTTLKCALIDKTGKVLAQTATLVADTGITAGAPKVSTFAFVAAVTIPTDDVYYASVLQNGAFGTPVQFARGLGNAFMGTTAGSGSAKTLQSGSNADYPATNSSLTWAAGNSVGAFWFGIS